MEKPIILPRAGHVRSALQAAANPAKAKVLLRFFKTGPGQYAEGDLFLGVVVPEQRIIAKLFADLRETEVLTLLRSKIHEERLTALLILVRQYKFGNQRRKRRIVSAYLKHKAYIDNWDLVDLSAPQILGDWLLDKDRRILFKLAKSRRVWDRRISMLATFAFICAGESRDTLALAEILLLDEHDLIHKAVGWMLREVGKRIGTDPLKSFLTQHAAAMPRTALRYAIEHFPERERKKWLATPQRPKG